MSTDLLNYFIFNIFFLSDFAQWIQQSILNILEDGDNNRLAYLTYQDVRSCFDDETILAVQAPNGTPLQVPVVDLVCLVIQ